LHPMRGPAGKPAPAAHDTHMTSLSDASHPSPTCPLTPYSTRQAAPVLRRGLGSERHSAGLEAAGVLNQRNPATINDSTRARRQPKGTEKASLQPLTPHEGERTHEAQMKNAGGAVLQSNRATTSSFKSAPSRANIPHPNKPRQPTRLCAGLPVQTEKQETPSQQTLTGQAGERGLTTNCPARPLPNPRADHSLPARSRRLKTEHRRVRWGYAASTQHKVRKSGGVLREKAASGREHPRTRHRDNRRIVRATHLRAAGPQHPPRRDDLTPKLDAKPTPPNPRSQKRFGGRGIEASPK